MLLRLLNTSESIAFTEFSEPTRKNLETLSSQSIGAVKVVYDDESSNPSTSNKSSNGSSNEPFNGCSKESTSNGSSDGSFNVELFGFVGAVRLMLDATPHQRYHALLLLGETKLI